MKIGRITFGEAYSEDALDAVINSHRQAVPYAFSAVDFTIIVKTSPTSILNLTMYPNDSAANSSIPASEKWFESVGHLISDTIFMKVK